MNIVERKNAALGQIVQIAREITDSAALWKKSSKTSDQGLIIFVGETHRQPAHNVLEMALLTQLKNTTGIDVLCEESPVNYTPPHVPTRYTMTNFVERAFNCATRQHISTDGVLIGAHAHKLGIKRAYIDAPTREYKENEYFTGRKLRAASIANWQNVPALAKLWSDHPYLLHPRKEQHAEHEKDAVSFDNHVTYRDFHQMQEIEKYRGKKIMVIGGNIHIARDAQNYSLATMLAENGFDIVTVSTHRFYDQALMLRKAHLETLSAQGLAHSLGHFAVDLPFLEYDNFYSSPRQDKRAKSRSQMTYCMAVEEVLEMNNQGAAILAHEQKSALYRGSLRNYQY